MIIKQVILLCLLAATTFPLAAQSQHPLPVKRCSDFEPDGKGSNQEWNKTSWVSLQQLDEGKKYATAFKILYSGTGLYVLFQGEDEKITSPFQKDFENLFQADVFEVFFHPNPATPIYFEYEISPLNKELVLLIPNINGRANGWQPWHYDNKKTKKAVFVDGVQEDGAAIRSWSAELYFPYALLSPLERVPPQAGTVWNANFYRLDYDSGKMIKWAWSPVKKSFHEFTRYKEIRFE